MRERVLVLAQDLIWADRLARAVLGAAGTPARVGTQDALSAAIATQPPGFVIVDLTARAYEPLTAIAAASAAGARVLAVGQHDDVEARKRAMAAGAERVLAYRKLFDDGSATIAAWMAASRKAPVTSVPG